MHFYYHNISIENLSKKFIIDSRYENDIIDDDFQEDLNVPLNHQQFDSDSDDFHQDEKFEQKYTWALRDITFTIKSGESIGITGKKGSGKSTLLKTICGIIPPTEGTINGSGIIMPVFSMLYPVNYFTSIRNNLFSICTLLNINNRLIHSKIEEIIDFSQADKWIDKKVCICPKSIYSRIAVATALHLDSDFLLFDDKYLFGDKIYQKKLQERLSEILEKGTAFIFASQNIKLLKTICNRIIWLDKGTLKFDGESHNITNEFIYDGNEIINTISLSNPFEKQQYDIESHHISESNPDQSKNNETLYRCRDSKESKIENVSDWLKYHEYVNEKWNSFLLKRKINKNKDSKNIICNIPNRNADPFGKIVDYAIMLENGTRVRDIMPGEDIYVEYSFQTKIQCVKIKIKLEFESNLYLIFTSEPSVPLLTDIAAIYSIKTVIPGKILGQNAELKRYKVRIRAHFSKEPEYDPVLLNATSWIDVRGDIRSAFFKALESEKFETSITSPCPSYLEDLDKTPFSDWSPMPTGIGKDRTYLLKRKPLFNFDLAWEIHRIIQE